jgi:hypothetical protein
VSLRQSRGPASIFTHPAADREAVARFVGNRRPKDATNPRHSAFDSGDAIDPTKPGSVRNPVNRFPTKLDRHAPNFPPFTAAALPADSCDRNRPTIVATTAPDTAPHSVTALLPTPHENPEVLKYTQRVTPGSRRHHALPDLLPARAVARFVAHSVALSPSPKTATKRADHSPSTTSNNLTLQQPTRPHRKNYRPCCIKLASLCPSSVKICDICG